MTKAKYQKLKELSYYGLAIISVIVYTNNALSADFFDYPSTEGTSLVGPKRMNPPREEWEREKPKGRNHGGKRNIVDYFTKENPELLEKASKALPEKIPLSWYSDSQ